ncbi:MAG: sugar-transfer associated ATP-grasp domain-containing protein, partial [Oscillospiraceae bacterium]
MSFLKYAFGANYSRFFKNLKNISKKNKISVFRLFFSFLGCFIKYGAGLTDFLNYQLYLKTPQQRKEYITIKDSDAFYALVSPEKYKTFFTIKHQFLSNFKKYIKRDWITPNGENFNEFSEFCNKHKVFFIKPYDGLAGSGVQKVDISKENKSIKELFDDYSNNKILVEELVENHKDIKIFAPNSCNTIRVVTCANKGKSKLLYAALRVGAGGNVDNFHAAGMGVMIDNNTGKLIGNGVNKNLENFEYHPMSKIKFDGYQLPFWKETIEMCLEAALVNDKIHVVGWDVAVTPSGPTFIEGNRRPGFDLPQMACKKGFK